MLGTGTWTQEKQSFWQFQQNSQPEPNDLGIEMHTKQALLALPSRAEVSKPGMQRGGHATVILTPSCRTGRISGLGKEILGSYDCHFGHARPALAKGVSTL